MNRMKPSARFHSKGGMSGMFAFLPVLLLISFAATSFSEEAPISKDDTNSIGVAKAHLDQWIWESRTFEKQTCRLWKSFVIPQGTAVSHATLRITVDNGYRLFLDGREIGRSSDWRTVTEYDVTWLLNPGQHVVAVEGFKERLEAGLIFNLEIQMLNQDSIEIVSDASWYVVPTNVSNWTRKRTPSPDWPHAIAIGSINQHP